MKFADMSLACRNNKKTHSPTKEGKIAPAQRFMGREGCAQSVRCHRLHPYLHCTTRGDQMLWWLSAAVQTEIIHP